LISLFERVRIEKVGVLNEKSARNWKQSRAAYLVKAKHGKSAEHREKSADSAEKEKIVDPARYFLKRVFVKNV